MEKENFMDLSEEASLMTNGGATCIKTNTTKTSTLQKSIPSQPVKTSIASVFSGGSTCH
jgi:hypothetical protein